MGLQGAAGNVEREIVLGMAASVADIASG